VRALVQALEDREACVRRTAVWALQQVGSERSAGALLEKLKDEDDGVRAAAAEALGTIWDERAIGPLVAALVDASSSVRIDAWYALEKGHPNWRKSGAAKAAMPLLAEALGHRDWNVRGYAAKVLGEVGDTRAVPPLVKALQDENDFVRGRAEATLQEITRENQKAAEAAAPLVMELIKHSDSAVRQRAVRLLGQLPKKAAAQSLVAALRDKDAKVRLEAAAALADIRDRGTVEALVEALHDDDAGVRRVAAKALRRIGDTRAVQPLLAVLSSDYLRAVRAAAAWALECLGWQPADVVDRELLAHAQPAVEFDAHRPVCFSCGEGISGRQSAIPESAIIVGSKSSEAPKGWQIFEGVICLNCRAVRCLECVDGKEDKCPKCNGKSKRAWLSDLVELRQLMDRSE
jgi:HEAT repeat protein